MDKGQPRSLIGRIGDRIININVIQLKIQHVESTLSIQFLREMAFTKYIHNYTISKLLMTNCSHHPQKTITKSTFDYGILFLIYLIVQFHS